MTVTGADVSFTASFLTVGKDQIPKDYIYAVTRTDSLAIPAAGSQNPILASIKNDGIHVLIHSLQLKNNSTTVKPLFKYSLIAFETPSEAQAFVASAKTWLGHRIHKKLLVVINPVSGTKQAKDRWTKTVIPMFDAAEVPYEARFTEKAEHATDITSKMSLEAYSGVISIGGDGTFHEVLNGLLLRPDWQEAVSSMSIGMISGGSANAFPRCIDAFTAELSTLTIIKGFQKPMDMFAAVTPKATIYSFLCIFYGFISDVDIDSNNLRALGPVRFPLMALYKLLKLQQYEVKLHLLPADDTTVQPIEPPSLPIDSPPQFGPPLKYIVRPDSHNSFPVHTDASLIYLNVMNLQWASSDFLAEVNARISDGCLWLNYGDSSIKRGELLQQILNQEAALDSENPKSHRVAVKAFVLEPVNVHGKSLAKQKGSKKAIMDVSGEEVDLGPIRCEVLPSLVTVFVPPWFNEEKFVGEAAELRAKLHDKSKKGFCR
ncbi:hypothetical protein SmJEL517_g01117 [Synchytrium microbalum]|uniref:DAGKc domain-containing protein n=1 Tax=Synchytrium microbalum TaxID=1806994 RepID=A0A507CGC3_9FUNG|nr:uncharacterized protein SmJEL517_g01117 [Synchytrium microbalum]TPX37066.1 hypothetical protein SmJEL517_g01117 [Synchytrium microbalum]